jgi:iron complex outermembrane receptor protein
LFLVLSGVFSSLCAQDGAGRIAGVVQDEKGGVLQTARVSVRETATGATQSTNTDDAGRYEFPSLHPGVYEVSGSYNGLATALRSGVEVRAGQAESVDLVLRVNGTGQSVTVTEEGYAVAAATAGTKTVTPLLETPMAVQVIPREVIEDRQQRTSLEVVKNVSGVQSSTYQFYDQFLLRGFDSGYGTTFRNGLQLRGINEAVNMAFVDHIEVVKGPSSMLYGRVEPGGFVNVVTEAPQETTSFLFEQQAGGWGALRTTAGATGRVLRDQSLLFRVTADFDKADSWVDNAHRKNLAGAASLAWHPTSKFDASLQFEQYDYRTAWLDASIPVIGDRPANLPRNFSILYPESWSAYPYQVVRSLLAYDWSYALSNSWRVTNRFHYVHSNEDQQGVYADLFSSFDGQGTIGASRFTHNPGWTRNMFGTNLDLTGEFRTGIIRHRFLAGFDWAKFTDDTPGSTGLIDGAAPISIFHPVYSSYLSELRALAATDATNILWRDRSDDTGVYFQDQMTFGRRLSLLVGGRYDRATDAYSDTYGNRGSSCYPNCTGYPVAPYPTDSAFSPRAGLLYRLSNSVSAYASYSKSFGDSNGRDNNGNALKPQIGVQYESGVKAVLMHGAVTTSATLFNLTKSNITEYDPINFFPRVVGQARSRGAEIDIAGQVSRHLNLIASYTYDQSEITRDPYNGTQGNRLGGVAAHVGSIWIRYDTAPGRAKGWSVGAGEYLSGQRQGDDANTWQLPGYGRLDAMLGYRAKAGRLRMSFQLNVNNTFDKAYFDHGGYGVAAYGMPRSAIISTKFGFDPGSR